MGPEYRVALTASIGSRMLQAKNLTGCFTRITCDPRFEYLSCSHKRTYADVIE